MKTVLVLGTGMVAGPAITYLLALPEIQVRVASLDYERAQLPHRRTSARRGAAVGRRHPVALRDAIAAPEVGLVISLLPYIYHAQVAAVCVAHGKHLITTSYVSPDMRALDRAREAGVTLLNEIGADPGMDHMSAMRAIHEAQEVGGEITRFRSWCGGLPAPEANTNPLGYKFS